MGSQIVRVALVLVLGLAACGGGSDGGDSGSESGRSSDSGSSSEQPVLRSLGGEIEGLEGSGLTLSLNEDAELLEIDSGETAFTFETQLPEGDTFVVAVSQQPVDPLQTCAVSGGEGTVDSSSEQAVQIACATETFAVGGTLSGLAEGATLILQNNGGDDLTLNENGSFAFETEVADGAPYEVSIAESPSDPAQSCELSFAEGTIDGEPVDNVEVRCAVICLGAVDCDDFTFCDAPCGEKGLCVDRPEDCSGSELSPVCDCEGRTWVSECFAHRGGKAVDFEGTCESTEGCLTNDQCGSDEFCLKREGDCMGFGTCEVTPTICTMEVDPVCGCDDRTHSNACHAHAARTSVRHRGECGSSHM